jgi:hypothetical protein
MWKRPVRHSKIGLENIGRPAPSKKKYIGLTKAMSGSARVVPAAFRLRRAETNPKS